MKTFVYKNWHPVQIFLKSPRNPISTENRLLKCREDLRDKGTLIVAETP